MKKTNQQNNNIRVPMVICSSQDCGTNSKKTIGESKKYIHKYAFKNNK